MTYTHTFTLELKNKIFIAHNPAITYMKCTKKRYLAIIYTP